MSTVLSQAGRILPPQARRSLKRLLGMPETRLHPDWSILSIIGPCNTPHTVLDIGAHAGWFLHCWLDWCPEATVHGFEPFPASFSKANGLYGGDPRVHLHQLAVGSESGRLSFNHLTDSRVSNSFLEPDKQAWESIAYETGEIEKIEVPIVTLDEFCTHNNIGDIFLIKIDVQGFEIEVLKGALSVLPRVSHILVESAIEPLYLGSPRFSDVFAFLTAQGFHLASLRAWHRGNHKLMETDLLFRRNGLEGPIDPNASRFYIGD
ncbi:MAG: FkbM family methyltransferase [Synechococcaceae cyanobacterium]|nr:FkbM family methyltransferase [Synechococcaceae cyanobacterium]